VEPFGRSKVSDNPDEIDFAQAGLLAAAKVIHTVPNRLEDRSERRHSDTG